MPANIATLPIGNLPIGTLTIAQAAGNLAQEPFTFPPGTWTFTPPKAGYWKFVQWGVGGSVSTVGNASGAYTEYTRFLTSAQSVALVVGIYAGVGTVDTTATFPDGYVVTAGKATGATPGTASGGDVNLNGSAGTAGSTSATGANGSGTGGGAGAANSGTNDGGAGAPANLPYRGGAGGASPGGGASQASQAVGNGLILAVFVKS